MAEKGSIRELPSPAGGLGGELGAARYPQLGEGVLIKAIPDIRLLRATDPAIAAQMTDLDHYRSASTMPPIRRDISVAVDLDDLAEDLGDRVRDALGEDAACVESVEILQETPCAVLPAQALARLGAYTSQKNLLVTVVLRHLEKTLTDREANVLRDRSYAAIHQGTVNQWATVPTTRQGSVHGL